MKKLSFCISFLVFSIVLMSQSQPDTLTYIGDYGMERLKITSYYPNGEIRAVDFLSKKPGALSKEEAFMRGQKIDSVEDVFAVLFPAKDRPPSRDSFHFYSMDGRLQERQLASREKVVRFTYEYDEQGNLLWEIEKVLSRSTPIRYKALGRLVFFNRRQTVEGRIGDIVHIDIPIAIEGEGKLRLNLSSSSRRVKTISMRTLDPDRDSSLSLAITVPSQISEEYLMLEDESGNSFSYPITIIGYDLFSQDFETSEVSDIVFPMEGRRQLVIKAEESKLICLYRDEELIDNYPTGQIRSEIDLKGFRRGQYVVEAIDLGANEKKYCKIRID